MQSNVMMRSGLALLLIALFGCGGDVRTTTDVRGLADRFTREYFDAFPQQATILGAATGPHDRLPDISIERRARWEATEDSILAQLDAIDPASLSAADAVTHGFLTEVIRNDQGMRSC